MIKSIALTGASGFIGRHILRELLDCDISITAITRFPTKLDEFASRVKIVEMDIARPEEDLYSKMGRPDVLLHLAWDGLPNYKSLHHIEEQLPCQYAFIRNLVTYGLPRLIVTGTCFEYGMQNGPLSEHDNTFPANPYGFAKDTLRKQLEFFKKENPFKFTWARLFYLYGAGQSEKSLWSQLQKAVLRGDKVFNMSGGEQIRDYLPVEIAASMIVRLALDDRDHGIVNVCSGEPISVRNLVEKWIQEYQSPIRINLGYYPYPEYEPIAFWGSLR